MKSDPSATGTMSTASLVPTGNPSASTSQTSKGSSAGTIIGGIIGGLALLALVLFLAWLILKRHRRGFQSLSTSVEPPIPPKPGTVVARSGGEKMGWGGMHDRAMSAFSTFTGSSGKGSYRSFSATSEDAGTTPTTFYIMHGDRRTSQGADDAELDYGHSKKAKWSEDGVMTAMDLPLLPTSSRDPRWSWQDSSTAPLFAPTPRVAPRVAPAKTSGSKFPISMESNHYRQSQSTAATPGHISTSSSRPASSRPPHGSRERSGSDSRPSSRDNSVPPPPVSGSRYDQLSYYSLPPKSTPTPPVSRSNPQPSSSRPRSHFYHAKDRVSLPPEMQEGRNRSSSQYDSAIIPDMEPSYPLLSAREEPPTPPEGFTNVRRSLESQRRHVASSSQDSSPGGYFGYSATQEQFRSPFYHPSVPPISTQTKPAQQPGSTPSSANSSRSQLQIITSPEQLNRARSEEEEHLRAISPRTRERIVRGLAGEGTLGSMTLWSPAPPYEPGGQPGAA
ncbi:hypothetical protein BT69DRAFT_454261 [Atractiella rhizophila]|nr:hypothetical protein BT69DRAFT_454261 [Atractiella rhizophila]